MEQPQLSVWHLRVVMVAGAASNCDMSDMATSTTNHRGRSRFRRATSTWKCQVRKRLRNSGMAYISRNGVARRPKLLKPGCGQKCRQRCHEHISDEQREHIFHSFWQLGNLHAQRQFLLSHVIRSEVNKKSKRTKILFSCRWSEIANMPKKFSGHIMYK